MKILNNLFYKIKSQPLNHIINLKAKNNFFNNIKRHFSLSLSFKNKMNSFFKYVHPDVLGGGDTPEEYRKTNEKSIQEVNSYLEDLSKSTNFVDKKTLYFYIKIEKKKPGIKENSQSLFEKISIDLEKLKPEMTESNKFSIQSK